MERLLEKYDLQNAALIKRCTDYLKKISIIRILKIINQKDLS